MKSARQCWLICLLLSLFVALRSAGEIVFACEFNYPSLRHKSKEAYSEAKLTIE